MRLSDSNGYCQAWIVRGKSKMAKRMILRVMSWATKTPLGGGVNHLASTINSLFIWPFFTVAFAVMVISADESPLVDI